MDFNIFTTPLLGLVAGFIAGKIMPGEEPGCIWGTLGFGIVGSFIGKFVFGQIGLYQDSTIMGIIASIVGACLVIFIWKKIIGPRLGGGDN
ncbi:MAG: GlsB/YeaQ/YmgE family stress response membrane protein [Chitinophagales bacterium]